jgi:hypothetical protein
MLGVVTDGRFYRPLTKKYIKDLANGDHERSDVIYYLHADRKAGVYVLRRKDYEQLYNRDIRVRACLERHYANSCIVFIGFSFEDPYVKECFRQVEETVCGKSGVESIYREIGRTAPQSGAHVQRPMHFLLMSSKNRELRRLEQLGKEEWSTLGLQEESGIRLIIYDSGHTFVDDLLGWLIESRNLEDRNG